MNNIKFDFGYILILLFYILVSIHFWSSSLFYFYKEIFFIIFLLLALFSFKNRKSYIIRDEIFFVLLFILYLIFAIIFIPVRDLYPNSNIELYSLNSLTPGSFNASLYVFRNAIIYLPLLLFIYIRNFSNNEKLLLLKVISFSGVLSIIFFIIFYDITKGFDVISYLLYLGGAELQYNSYIPYLTFPFVCSLYLYFLYKNKNYRYIYLFVSIFIFLYIIISGGRQSILFCVIAIFLFNLFVRNSLILNLIPVLIIVYFGLNYIINNYYVDDGLLTRITTLEFFSDSTNRFAIVTDGIKKLNISELIYGAGVSSIIYSGPHNDYVRWLQRIGIIGMILSFYPFILASIRSFKTIIIKKSINDLFIFLCLFYTIYISLFGYPREDAYQAPFAWLGLSLWLIYSKSDNKKC